MKTLARFLLASAALCGLISTATAADSIIYKGTYSNKLLLTPASQTASAYLVVGDEVARNDGFDTTVTVIAYGLYKGKKIAYSNTLGTFRGIRSSTAGIASEVLCNGSARFDVDKSHHTDSTYLLGTIKGTKYSSPLQLEGLAISVEGNNDFTTSFSEVTSSKFSFTLSQPLTDAAKNAGDTHAQAVQRVINLLQNKGYLFPM